jgi:cold shock CspA family protein
MANGSVKKLVQDRGFGFITPEGATDGKDLFFHRSDVGGDGFDALRMGQAITFDLGKDERKGTPKALNVKPAA